MAIALQICADCKHNHEDTESSIRVDGIVYSIVCPCPCHTRVRAWY
jgi:hypothetical protein